MKYLWISIIVIAVMGVSYLAYPKWEMHGDYLLFNKITGQVFKCAGPTCREIPRGL